MVQLWVQDLGEWAIVNLDAIERKAVYSGTIRSDDFDCETPHL